MPWNWTRIFSSSTTWVHGVQIIASTDYFKDTCVFLLLCGGSGDVPGTTIIRRYIHLHIRSHQAAAGKVYMAKSTEQISRIQASYYRGWERNVRLWGRSQICQLRPLTSVIPSGSFCKYARGPSFNRIQSVYSQSKGSFSMGAGGAWVEMFHWIRSPCPSPQRR
jgi:hypothetical protein